MLTETECPSCGEWDKGAAIDSNADISETFLTTIHAVSPRNNINSHMSPGNNHVSDSENHHAYLTKSVLHYYILGNHCIQLNKHKKSTNLSHHVCSVYQSTSSYDAKLSEPRLCQMGLLDAQRKQQYLPSFPKSGVDSRNR